VGGNSPAGIARQKVAVDSESGTLVWPNGVDFCPDVLYAEATGKDIEELGNELEVALD